MATHVPGLVTTATAGEPSEDRESLRPGWERVAADLVDLGPSGLLGRRTELARLLRNEGATYNVTVGGQSLRQPWTLDSCPLVIDEDEWAELEAGVAQRVALLDRVYADIYGERRLLTAGLLPAELVLGHPSFLRPCVGMAVPEDLRLFVAAVDVARDRHGELRALGDRVQAPSGLGYALVNRTVLSRVLPALHRELGVERLAGFFRSIRAAVAAAAPDGTDEPRVVILTPGPLSETYFEHAYLASYLGYPLVEGRDLEVANNRVWLRSLGGIEAVDVVIRRVDDRWCDPVELRADSLLGVPGLLEVARRGRVAIVNPLGSGIIENPALLGRLESLAPALLDEDLALRGPETWWCGTSSSLSHVLAHLDEMILLPVDPSPADGPLVPSLMPSAALDELKDRIRSKPGEWVGQEAIEPSASPTVTDAGSLESRPTVVRTFAVSDARNASAAHHGYTVMPGGLTRVGAAPGAVVISGRRDGTSKDTWVASAKPALQQSAWMRSTRPAPTLAGSSVEPAGEPAAALPGRVAARLFVLGRTGEHAELVIRLLRTVLARLDQPVGLGVSGGAESLGVLLSALGTVSGFDRVSEPDDPDPTPIDIDEPPAAPSSSVGAIGPATDTRALALLLDASVDGSLVSTLGLLVDAAFSVREQLSADSWQLVGDVEEEIVRLRTRPPTHLADTQSSLQRLLLALLGLSGLVAENMERDPSWLFLDAGRRIERAQSLVKLVRAVLVPRRAAVVEDLLVESLLKTSDSLITFRRRSGSILEVAAALDLVVFDVSNPRSVSFQLDRLFEHLSELPARAPSGGSGDGQRILLDATTTLERTDASRLAIVDSATDHRPELDAVLGRVDDLLAELLDTMRRTYFVHERLSVLHGRPT
jgi:uncharacterized circularly permuted ATP-grasp superfamily protein/uncharacterized alpha-E superfamily protein